MQYLIGLGYFAVWGHRQVVAHASQDHVDILSSDEATPTLQRGTILDLCTVGVLWLTLLAVLWIVVAAYWPLEVRFASDEVETVLVVALISLSLAMVCLVAWLHTRPRKNDGSSQQR